MKKNKIKKFVLIFAVIILFQQIITGKENLSEIARQQAISDLIQELEAKVSKSVGYEISAKDYLQALNHFSNGEVEKGKNLVTELAFKEMFTLVGGAGLASTVGLAWEFDKWVWKSVQEWGHDRRKEKFTREFLIPRMKKWYQEKRFGSKRSNDPGYTRQLTIEFNNYLNNEFGGGLDESSRTLYYQQKKKNKKFRNEMWELLLNAVREVSIKTKLKEASDQVIQLLSKAIDERQQQYLDLLKQKETRKSYSPKTKPGRKSYDRGNETTRIESEFRALYPRWLRSRDIGTNVTTVKINARKESSGKYFISIETRCTDDKGKTWICAKRTLYMTFGDLKRNIVIYKRDLGMK